jgi:hypothetical protein
MKLSGVIITLDDDEDAIGAKIPKLDVGVSIHGAGEVLICNDSEERKYRLVETEHGGYKLEEVELL